MVFKAIGEVIGTLTGSILGLSVAVVAEVLKLPVEAVRKAIESGCETYEEVRSHIENDN